MKTENVTSTKAGTGNEFDYKDEIRWLLDHVDSERHLRIAWRVLYNGWINDHSEE